MQNVQRLGLAFLLLLQANTALAIYPSSPVFIPRPFVAPAQNGDMVDYELHNTQGHKQLYRGTVYAVAGQKVTIKHNSLLVNGKEVLIGVTILSKSTVKPLIVPKNHVFIVANNHAGTQDSLVLGAFPITIIKQKISVVVPP